MKTRKHHNNYGARSIKTGACERQVIKMAKKLGIPYGSLSSGDRTNRRNMDPVIYEMKAGKMTRTNAPIHSSPQHANFVIVCQYGDWSGFRTLPECESQFPELETYHQESHGARTFWVEER